MVTTREVIEHVESLPVEDRAIVIDSLLRTLNPTDDEVDKQWAALAERRLAELRSGGAEGIPAEDVLAEARRRLQS